MYKERILQIVEKNILIYSEVPAIFKKWKLFRVCDARLAKFADFFGIDLLKIYLMSRNV